MNPIHVQRIRAAVDQRGHELTTVTAVAHAAGGRYQATLETVHAMIGAGILELGADGVQIISAPTVGAAA